MTPNLLLFLFYFIFLSALVTPHGYISKWASDDQKFDKAQKVDLSETAFRSVPDNTGWIGSHFINTAAMTCGSSVTPSNQIAPPSGNLFSKPEQSAKKTLPVKAGGKISVIISGEPGKGFPHHNGHIQAFLGRCGGSPDSCQNFDAVTASYHRIQAELDGISNKLMNQFDHEHDGNKWEIPIPGDTPSGSYILRLELVTFGQSSESEGHQDQYYVFCGQISIQNPGGANDWKNRPAIQFSSGYKPGNIDPKTLPGNTPIEKTTSEPNSESTSPEPNSESGQPEDSPIQESSAESKPGIKPKSKVEPTTDDEGHSQSPLKPDCADYCFKKKGEEIHNLAPKCTADQFSCLCQTTIFIQAYQICCYDHCKGSEEIQTAFNEIYHKCSSASAPIS
ncbi:hypothetical protein O181_065824 [Austropuccinia psidii MF-1]|uniref:lytic cellulose monooxygenase (C4-dehydrogenating) n=1 Tax=Austropuccinia psidii MF-1 TaxID=1389203 RepID=A0A9Q3ERT3_9BASI|nr:hypothetical protein [Austropuccinia psidii MF-1]